QLSDAAQVMAGLTRVPGISYTALTPNMKGFEAAKNASADEIAIFGAASEAFSKANINCSIEDSLARFIPMMAAAKTAGIPVRGYVSCITDCPYEGAVSPQRTASVAQALFDMGCYEISLGDTIGQATPERLDKTLQAVLDSVPASALAGHYHDTNQRALENILLSLGYGIRVFDAAIGGLGGCPYAPGAKGNVATEAVAALMQAQGFETGLDLIKLEKAARMAKGLVYGAA
ncbi:MAG: hydroxymethylglutaryl-CoA lyase, partial [Rhodobacteraceae bacterium]|nr:hydroxymethylglutaryl-CoA lyase [Paracoccaceae bacterium]